MRLSGYFVLLYIFFSSWTNAFALSDWLPIYIVILFLSVLFSPIDLLVNIKVLRVYARSEDFFLILFFLSVVFLGFVNWTPKFFNYALAYFLTIFFNFFFIRDYVLRRLRMKQVLNVNVWGVFFVSLFSNVEFVLGAFFNVYVQDYIPRTMIANAEYMLGIRRVYAFSEEPTYLAWYFETLGVVAVWTIVVMYKNVYFKLLFSLSLLSAFLSTFSAAGIGTLSLGFLLVFIFKIKKNSLNVLVLSLVAVIFFTLYHLYSDYFEVLVVKLALNQEGSGHRKDLWLSAFEEYKRNPILGSGLGSYSSRGLESPVNYFLFLLSETGILPFLLLIMFYIRVLYVIFKSSFKHSPIFLIAISSGIIHMFTQSLYFHPCLWLSIIIFYKVHSNLKFGVT